MTQYKYPDQAAYQFVCDALKNHGVTIRTISQLAYNLQKQYSNVPPLPAIDEITKTVLHKREILDHAMMGLELDSLANQNQLREPLASIIRHDLGVFGVDEVLALPIATVYGTIGMTNFNEIDLNKPGIIRKLDHDSQHVTTFIDDLVGALVAAVSAKLAHADS